MFETHEPQCREEIKDVSKQKKMTKFMPEAFDQVRIEKKTKFKHELGNFCNSKNSFSLNFARHILFRNSLAPKLRN